MKTTLEIPDRLFRRAKSAAAERGIPLRALVEEALTDKLSMPTAVDQPWMRSFGKLRRLHADTVRLNELVASEFGRVEESEWN